MLQISFLNLAKALILLTFSVAKLNFVLEAFECKNGLTFDTSNLLAFAKLRTEPYAAAPCVYSLCSFWGSYFVRDPASSIFALAFSLETREEDIPAASS